MKSVLFEMWWKLLLVETFVYTLRLISQQSNDTSQQQMQEN